MKKILRSSYLSIVILFLNIFLKGCSDTTDPVESNNLFYQEPGCMNKTSLADSCFDYTFTDKLIVEFCVSGNCCPDSNRFIFQQVIIQDTINLTVTDIEERLCRCICNYILHSENTELPLNSYQYNIFLKESTGDTLIYSQRVYRVIK